MESRMYMMPRRLRLVRHIESDGNVASRLCREGRFDEVPPEMYGVPGWQWRGTLRGVKQGLITRQWLEKQPELSTRGIISEYVRAEESGGLLGDFEEGFWHRSLFLRERDYGDLDCIPGPDQVDAYVRAKIEREKNRLFWTPPNGESIATVIQRMHQINGTMSRKFSQDVVLFIAHGDVIEAEIIILCRIGIDQYYEMSRRKDPLLNIRNCQVVEFSRISPFTGEERPHLDWVRTVCPWDRKDDGSEDWREIKRIKPSSAMLRERVEKYPRFFKEEVKFD